MADYKKFIFSPDKHWGYFRRRPVHDLKAIVALLKFAADFKPDVWIEGGDSLDLSGISHWNANKPLDIEGLDIDQDMAEYSAEVLDPIDAIMRGKEKHWMMGNHEQWTEAVRQSYPAMRNSPSINLERGLDLARRKWAFHEQGAMLSVGELRFIHGDTLGGGEHVAKAGVIAYEHNIRFGHFHTHQIYTKHSLAGAKSVKTGAAVGCLCNRNPHFNKKKPNKWVQGFNYGYVFSDGTFSDYFPVVIGGRFAAEGRTYRG